MANMLESVGVRNMTADDSDESEDDEDIKFGPDWIQLVISNTRDHGDKHSSSDKPKKKRKRRWKCRKKLPYSSSLFYRDYHSPTVRDLDHIDAKEFRLDYRMPWNQAHRIVSIFVHRKWVLTQEDLNERGVFGHRVCPPEIKILGTLYWLGEGCSFRTIYNLSGRVLTAQSFRDFAKKFTRKVKKFLAPKFIKIPRTVAELTAVSKTFETRGFPGACGSTDGVQIAWEGCPYAYRHSFTGKEKYPTLGFNVTVDHNMRVIHVCSMFAGRFNDKTKVLYDTYVQKLRSGFYDGFSYNLRDPEGVVTTHNTPYLICDGGYHRWVQLMCPMKTTSVKMFALFSKLLESVRKDAECTFGVMKKRFKVSGLGSRVCVNEDVCSYYVPKVFPHCQVLKVPLLFREVSFMEDIFITCCVLHNMLLDHDCPFREGCFRLDPCSGHKRRVLVNNVNRLLRRNDDYSYTEQGGLDPMTTTQIDSDFSAMRRRLACHTYYMFKNRLI